MRALRPVLAGILMVGAIAVTLEVEGQQPERIRHIGMLHFLLENDSEGQVYVRAFLQTLQESGWIVDRNLRIDYRWSGGDPERTRKYAAELVALAPDVILAAGGSQVGPLQQATRTIPIVFVQVADAVGGGFVSSLARPGGNATGFTNFEFNISAKWLELLKQVAPRMTRTAVLRDPANPNGAAQFGAIQAVAPSFGVEVAPISLRDAEEMERGIAAFARGPNGGLIITPGGLAIVHRKVIVTSSARHRLPAIYPFRHFVVDGGLISYGPDVIDQYRRAGGYVDRILRGEKPGSLPVQQSTRVEMVINLKTAKALGLSIPPSVLARADEIIPE